MSRQLKFSDGERAYLLDKEGNPVLDVHRQQIPVRTDVYTGQRFQLVALRLSGTSKEQQAQQKQYADAGVLHYCSDNSSLAGWWAPVNEANPSSEPLAPGTQQAA